MTDEELGREIVRRVFDNKAEWPLQYAYAIGLAARTLLTKPVATRDAVIDFFNARWPISEGYWAENVDYILAALTHFAPPGELPPICRMTKSEIAGAIFNSPEWKAEAQIPSHVAAAIAVHRLAQPAVDPDREAKKLHQIYMSRLRGIAGRTKERWEDLPDDSKDGWRACVAEGGLERAVAARRDGDG